MSKKKYYAVRVGKTPGIYFTWADCSAQVTGFKGAKYKSFQNIEEALEFMGETNLDNKKPVIKKESTTTKKKVSTTAKVLKEGYNVKPIRSSANVKTYKSYIDPMEMFSNNL